MATTPIVNSTAVINGVDHETFGDNETGSASRASERLFQGPDQPGAAVPGVQVGRRVPRRPVRQRKAPGRRHAGSQRGGTAFRGHEQVDASTGGSTTASSSPRARPCRTRDGNQPRRGQRLRRRHSHDHESRVRGVASTGGASRAAGSRARTAWLARVLATTLRSPEASRSRLSPPGSRSGVGRVGCISGRVARVSVRRR